MAWDPRPGRWAWPQARKQVQTMARPGHCQAQQCDSQLLRPTGGRRGVQRPALQGGPLMPAPLSRHLALRRHCLMSSAGQSGLSERCPSRGTHCQALG